LVDADPDYYYHYYYYYYYYRSPAGGGGKKKNNNNWTPNLFIHILLVDYGFSPVAKLPNLRKKIELIFLCT
jgi:hypothetical protein